MELSELKNYSNYFRNSKNASAFSYWAADLYIGDPAIVKDMESLDSDLDIGDRISCIRLYTANVCSQLAVEVH